MLYMFGNPYINAADGGLGFALFMYTPVRYSIFEQWKFYRL